MRLFASAPLALLAALIGFGASISTTFSGPSETSGLSESSELSEFPEFSGSSELSESPELSESSELFESSELSETSGLSESSELSEFPEFSESSELSESPELSESSELSVSFDISEPFRFPESFGLRESTGAPEASDSDTSVDVERPKLATASMVVDSRPFFSGLRHTPSPALQKRWRIGWLTPAQANSAQQLAYVRSTDAETQACLFWPTRNIPWWLNNKEDVADADFEGVKQALLDSFSTWSDVECSDLDFHFEGLTPRSDVGYRRGSSNNINLLIFRTKSCSEVVSSSDNCWEVPGQCANKYDCWDHPSAVIALTTTSYNRSTGLILDSDIEFNSEMQLTTRDGPPCTSAGQSDCAAFDIANTATHEIGHMIGLDHSEGVNSTMYGKADRGELSKRELSGDDEMAICSIYPRGAAPDLCTPSGSLIVRKSDEEGCGKSSSAWLLLLVAWGWPRLYSRRHRRS